MIIIIGLIIIPWIYLDNNYDNNNTNIEFVLPQYASSRKEKTAAIYNTPFSEDFSFKTIFSQL